MGFERMFRSLFGLDVVEWRLYASWVVVGGGVGAAIEQNIFGSRRARLGLVEASRDRRALAT